MSPTRPLALLITLLLCSLSVQADSTDRLLRKAQRYFAPLPATMPGGEADSTERVALGRKLYFDTRLSINDTQSCASCHPVGQGRAGMDNLATSPGARGEFGNRNTPTVLNAGWQKGQFWDGRANDLADQAGQPILNPVEMGMPSADAVIDKLALIEEYPEAFANAFPGSLAPLSYANLAEAIAAFERTLRSPSRFDTFLEGDKSALSELELEGLNRFIRSNCVRCHDGPLLGGTLYEKLGVEQPFHNTRDQGRYEVTGNEEDRMVFKVAQLRNVAVTGPWFHDGSASTLEEAVQTMARIQLATELNNAQVNAVVAFLNALTDPALAR